MPDLKTKRDPAAAIEKVERLREKIAAQQASTGSAWSLTGWRTVDWLLVVLIIAFVLYVLLPRT